LLLVVVDQLLLARRALGRRLARKLKRRACSPFFQQGQDAGQIGQDKERHAQANMTDNNITIKRKMS
jgi:hypothetical protein